MQESKQEVPKVISPVEDGGNGTSVFIHSSSFLISTGSCFGLKSTENAQVEEQEEIATFEEDQDHIEDEHNFKIMMDNLGATSLFDEYVN